MVEREPDRDKLVGDELRELVSVDAGDPVSVFVELDAPTPRVTIAGGRPEAGRPVPIAVSESEDERERLETAVRDARALLTRLTGEEPVWLGAARAFVVRVTPDQLRRVLASPLVRRVSRNRRIG